MPCRRTSATGTLQFLAIVTLALCVLAAVFWGVYGLISMLRVLL